MDMGHISVQEPVKMKEAIGSDRRLWHYNCRAARRGVLFWLAAAGGVVLAQDIAELLVEQRGIQPAVGQQFRVSALFDDVPPLQHHDAIAAQNRRQPVGDDQRGATGQQFLQRLLNQVFAGGVEVAGRFVEDQQCGAL
jgi:hypothetical protein